MTDLIKLPFETDKGCGPRARIGLVVLDGDQTLEGEFQSLQLDGVTCYHSRIHMADEVSSESLGAMEKLLPEAASLLVDQLDIDVIGYGCTSASTVIGAERVHAALHVAHPGKPATDPISAAIEAFAALGSKRIAVITPYLAEVTQRIVGIFESNGIGVGAAGSFLEGSDQIVARISEQSVVEGVRRVVAAGDCDAAFVSCTSLRSYAVIPSLEAELGIDVVSSNQAFLWHLLRLAGIDDQINGMGRLFLLDPTS